MINQIITLRELKDRLKVAWKDLGLKSNDEIKVSFFYSALYEDEKKLFLKLKKETV